MNEIYQNDNLKYKLNEQEYNNINDVWDFLNIFNKKMVFLRDYRKEIINNMQKYNSNQFYEYEKIATKLYFNLKSKINITNVNNINIQSFENKKELNDIIRKYKQNNNYYRSFINKLVVVDQNNKKITTKIMEGSSRIFKKDKQNAILGYILLNRELYEKTMKNIKTFDNIELPNIYYQFDYGFPNLNYDFYDNGSETYQKKRIKQMYYVKNCDKNWFKIIK